MSNDSAKTHSVRSGAYRGCRALGQGFLGLGLAAGVVGLAGCRSPHGQIEAADEVAYATIATVQEAALGEAQPFTVLTPSDALRRRLIEEQGLHVGDPASVSSRNARFIPHWPEGVLPVEPSLAPGAPVAVNGDGEVVLSLVHALHVAARNSRDYQDSKEAMFEEALNLDLRRYDFSTQLASDGEAALTNDETGDQTTRELSVDAGIGATRTLWNGALLSAGFTLNFLEVLKGTAESSVGMNADVSVTIPLLRGAGRHIAREPLTQAERSMLYAVYTYERYKRVFVVDVTQRYLNVLRQLDGVYNAEENYDRLRESVERTQALAEEERLPGIQVDQARQDELRARSGWISAQRNFLSSLDQFKVSLGLPPDADVVLDPAELVRVLDVDTMPNLDDLEVPVDATKPADESWLDPDRAVAVALAHRLDLQVASGRIEDAQRKVVIAADRLRPELTVGGSAEWSSRDSDTRFDDTLEELSGGRSGVYRGLLTVDPGLDRRVERDALRSQLLSYEASVRQYQEVEDGIKLDIQDAIRNLAAARENVVIQRNAVDLAARREESTKLFLNLDRAEVRDVLDAQSDLLDARNAYTTAQVSYRISFLALQRDLGLLEVDEQGVWIERNYQTLLEEQPPEN